MYKFKSLFEHTKGCIEREHYSHCRSFSLFNSCKVRIEHCGSKDQLGMQWLQMDNLCMGMVVFADTLKQTVNNIISKLEK